MKYVISSKKAIFVTVSADFFLKKEGVNSYMEEKTILMDWRNYYG